MDGITFGQYIPVQSFVHSLDPRAKLYLVVMLMAAILGVHTFLGVAVTVVYTTLLILSANVPLGVYWRGTRPLFVVIAITVAFQIFLVPGQVIYQWWFFSVTNTGIQVGALMTYRLIMVFMLAQLLTFTTSPLQLTDGLERILKPFNRLGVPAHELAMIMTIALRFIPVIFEESNKIVKAQVSRGVDFQGGWIKSFRNLVSIIVPLFTRAFRRADELALAMEARCYTGGEGRSSLYYLSMSLADYSIMVITTGLMLVVFLSGM